MDAMDRRVTQLHQRVRDLKASASSRARNASAERDGLWPGRSSLFLHVLLFLLSMTQDHQLRIGGEDFTHRMLKAFTGFNTLAYMLDVRFGDMDNPSFSIGHERQRVVRMPFTGGAVTGGLAAGDGAIAQGSGEEIFRNVVASELVALAFAPACGVGACG